MNKTTIYSFLFLCITFFSNSLIAAHSNNNPIHLNASQSPWRAIGILKNKDRTCTAIIVGKYALLTSAYCLLNDEGRKPDDLSSLVFKGGYQNGYFLIISKIQSFLLPKLTYPPRSFDDLKNSWAFLFTKRPVGEAIGTFKIHTDTITSKYLKSHKIITVGYKNSGEPTLLASIKCKLNSNSINFNNKLPKNPAPFFLQECDDYFKPLLGSAVISINNQNKVSLIGIISANLTKGLKSKSDKYLSKSNSLKLNVVISTSYLKSQSYKKQSDDSNKNLLETLQK